MTTVPPKDTTVLLRGETSKRSSHIFKPENGEEILDESGYGTGR